MRFHEVLFVLLLLHCGILVDTVLAFGVNLQPRANTNTNTKKKGPFTFSATKNNVMVHVDHNKGTPILSSNLFCTEEAEEKDSTRKSCFDRLQTVVDSLTEMGEDVSLIWQNDREVDHAGVVPINSLLFQADDRSDPFVVVVPSSRKVNVRALEAYLEQDNHDERIPNRTISYSLVPADLVERKCGFPPQSVPPLGHVPHNLRTIVEESLVRQGSILLGGGGHPLVGCLVAAETLARLEGTELANLTDPAPNSPSDSDINSNIDQTNTVSRPLTSSLCSETYFPLRPPATEDVQEFLSHSDSPNPFQPVAITLVGRINGIRRMARRLVFCDLAPLGYLGTGTKMDSFDLPWKSARDGSDMSVQLIAGKTFCKNRGDAPGAEALKSLKVGHVLLVEAKTNVGNRDSLRHWVEKKSLELVVFDFRQLEDAPGREQQRTMLPSPFVKVERRKTSHSTKEIEKSVDENPNLSPPPAKDAADYLALSDIFPGCRATIKVVDSIEGVIDFQQSLEVLRNGINGDRIPELVGIDCEWKPSFMRSSSAETQPVLLLQISLQKLGTVYLLDLQELLRPCRNPLEATTETERLISLALSDLFGSHQFIKIGFQVTNDLQRLAGSYPHIQAFRSFVAVLEVGSVAAKALQISGIRNSRQLTTSLASLTKYLLNKPLAKEQQISDWSLRPLTEEQKDYASLDAAIAPVLLEKAMDMAGAEWMGELGMGRHADDAAFARSLSTLRFLFLEEDDAVSARKLKAKQIVSDHWVVKQSWVTGRDEPKLPSAPSKKDGLYTDVTGCLRIPAITVDPRPNDKDNAVFESLIGRRLGKSKNSCLEAILCGNPDFPVGARLEFQQRSGHVEFAECVALFVNMPKRPGGPSPRGYPNKWLEDGRFLTWFMRENEWENGASHLAQKLLKDPLQSPPAILFVRLGRGDFLCCGKCRVHPMAANPEPSVPSPGVSSDRDWGLTELKLELVDWSALQNVTSFTQMIWKKEIDGTDSSVADDEETEPVAQILAKMVLDGDFDKARRLALQITNDTSK